MPVDRARREYGMIRRMWHGWTAAADAAAYERLLREHIFPGIVARGVAGLRGPGGVASTGR